MEPIKTKQNKIPNAILTPLVITTLIGLLATYFIKINKPQIPNQETPKESLVKELALKSSNKTTTSNIPFENEKELSSTVQNSSPPQITEYQKDFNVSTIQKIERLQFGTHYIDEKQKYIEALASSDERLFQAAAILPNETLFKSIFKENHARAKILLIDSLIFAAKKTQNSKALIDAINNLLHSIREQEFKVSDATWMDFEELLAAYLSITIQKTDLQSIQASLQNMELRIDEDEFVLHPNFKDTFITALYTSLRNKLPKQQLDTFIETYNLSFSKHSEKNTTKKTNHEGSSYEG